MRGERIVYTSTLSAEGTVSFVSLTTVERQPDWREQGSGEWRNASGQTSRTASGVTAQV